MKVVSLFCGAGGMDLGFKQAGFEVIWANDNYKYACETYQQNFKIHVTNKDVTKIKKFPKADILLACNPCQGFSMIGKRDEHDQRNTLYRQIFRALKQVNPRYFVVENVSGLKNLYGGRFLDRMIYGFDKLGYLPTWRLLNARDYGIPQNRQRIIIIGIRKDLNINCSFPPITHGPGLKPYVSVRMALRGLRAPRKDEYFANPNWRFFYMSRNRRVEWDNVSFTIQAVAENIPLHPSSPPLVKISKDHWKFGGRSSKYRRFSVQECARIQTFPDDFKFLGELGSKYRLIGNAVPPLLARRIAESIKRMEMNRRQVNENSRACFETQGKEVFAGTYALVRN